MLFTDHQATSISRPGAVPAIKPTATGLTTTNMPLLPIPLMSTQTHNANNNNITDGRSTATNNSTNNNATDAPIIPQPASMIPASNSSQLTAPAAGPGAEPKPSVSHLTFARKSYSKI